jgi:NAD(P)-dependent dehydrogenase (short-subunit alcohol dehydrogenase family)
LSLLLEGKRAFVSGGTRGIGAAICEVFAREGADVAIVYLTHDDDAEETKRAVERQGKRCVLVKGDVGDPELCRRAIETTLDELGHLDIVVSNAAFQQRAKDLEHLSVEQIERTFRTNILGCMFLTRAALPH